MHNHYVKKLIISVLFLIFSCVCAIGLTFSWFSQNQLVGAGNDISSAPGSQTEYVTGHDIYMWDTTKSKGILKDNQLVTMNQFDTVFTENNEYTPIILRAVLSADWADRIKNHETLKLNLTSVPIQKIKAKDSGADTFSRDTTNAGELGIENYLSNVVSVKAAYISGLETNAAGGNYADLDAEHTYADCTDKNDYIYRYAVDYFDVNTDITPVQFVTASSTPHTETTTVTENYYKITKVTATDQLTTTSKISASTGETISNQAIVGYLIGNGSNFLSISSGSVANASASVTEGTVTSISDLSDILWTQSSGTAALSTTTTLYNNGYYLNYSNNRLSASSNGYNWTLSANNNTIRFKPSNSTYNYYLYYNNGWSVRYNNSNTTLYKVEQYTKTTTTSKTVSVTSYDNVISIDVNLNQAQEDNGNYYVYLMIDYNSDLVKAYFQHNSINFKLGQDATSFSDQLNITPEVSTAGSA